MKEGPRKPFSRMAFYAKSSHERLGRNMDIHDKDCEH